VIYGKSVASATGIAGPTTKIYAAVIELDSWTADRADGASGT